MCAVLVALRRIPAVECGATDAAHQRAPGLAVELLAPRAPGLHLGAFAIVLWIDGRSEHDGYERLVSAI